MMINTDGAATVANYPLKKGRDVQVTPPSLEGRSISSIIAERERTAAADRAAIKLQEDRDAGPRPKDSKPVFVECYTVIGTYPPADLTGEHQRWSETFEARSAEEAESMAPGDVLVAGVIKGESDVVA